MSIQYSTAVRNARLDSWESTINITPILRIYSGALPANPAATIGAATLLVAMTLPSDWLANASGSTKTSIGTWSGTAVAGSGAIPTFYRIWDSAGTACGEQGTCGVSAVFTTSALTATNGNILTFASTTGTAVGQLVTGTGVPTGAAAIAVTGTTVTLSASSTAGVASAAAITFGYDLNINGTITSGQTVSIAASSFTRTEGNA